MDNWEGIVRYGFDAKVTQQDLSEYYLPPFQTCVRDAKVASVMCSYNAVNGIPACANKFLLQTILRDTWGFTDDRWVTSDCDAVGNIDCGTFSSTHLPEALAQGLITTADLKKAAARQYASLVRFVAMCTGPLHRD